MHLFCPDSRGGNISLEIIHLICVTKCNFHIFKKTLFYCDKNYLTKSIVNCYLLQRYFYILCFVALLDCFSLCFILNQRHDNIEAVDELPPLLEEKKKLKYVY